MPSSYDWAWYRFKVTRDTTAMDLIGCHCDSYWMLDAPDEKCWLCGEQPEVHRMGETYAGWAFSNTGGLPG